VFDQQMRPAWRRRRARRRGLQHAAILTHLDKGGAGLDPTVRQAIERLKSAG
jgi:hypothetical protein